MKLTARLNLFAGLTVAAIFAGCAPAPAPAPTKPSTPVAQDDKGHTHDGEGAHAHPHKEGGHGHGAGPHEGTLADWGGGKYHVEFTVDHDKHEATIYVLGSDEKTPTPIKATDGKLLLTITDPKFQVDLTALPLEGEAEGTSSRFVGKNEKLGVVQEFAGTISGEVDGTPFAGDFKEEPHVEEKK